MEAPREEYYVTIRRGPFPPLRRLGSVLKYILLGKTMQTTLLNYDF